MVTVKASKSTLLILTACLISLTVLILDSLNLPTFIDEISFLLNVKYFAQYGTFIPFYTKYPTLYSYIIAVPVYFVFLVFYFVKGLPLNGLGDTAFLRFVFYENLIMWNWVSRCITMLFSVATLTMVLKRAIKKYGPMAFFTTAAILVLDPFGVYMDLSRFGLPDIPMTFFVTAAMFLCLSYLDGKNLKYLYWASFVSGLAASTKFNAVMMIFPLFVAPLIIGKEKRRLPLCYVRIIFLVILGFLAGSPAFLFSFRTLLDGFIFEAKILFEEGHLGAHGIIWIWALDLLWEMNPVVLFLMISSIFYSALKRTKEDLLFLSLFVPSFLILGALEKKSIWYFVFLYPLAALYA
ncbi:MAG: glycosyltransferase family 39 protein, partial [Candidatus Omnitrophota bacterium]